MERGLFSFLIVLALVPAILLLTLGNLEAQSMAIEQKKILLAQQALLNKENDFETTFWQTAKQNPDDLVKSLSKWREDIRDKGIKVYTTTLDGPNYTSLLDYEGEWDTTFVKKSASNDRVLVSSGSTYAVVYAQIETGGGKSVYLIPHGSYEPL